MLNVLKRYLESKGFVVRGAYRTVTEQIIIHAKGDVALVDYYRKVVEKYFRHETHFCGTAKNYEKRRDADMKRLYICEEV
jgi:hypothetical protein